MHVKNSRIPALVMMALATQTLGCKKASPAASTAHESKPSAASELPVDNERLYRDARDSFIVAKYTVDKSKEDSQYDIGLTKLSYGKIDLVFQAILHVIALGEYAQYDARIIHELTELKEHCGEVLIPPTIRRPSEYRRIFESMAIPMDKYGEFVPPPEIIAASVLIDDAIERITDRSKKARDAQVLPKK